ncbi:HSP40/DnaJ peptide-binding protein [Perilla frutescens var. frutescens]|nr:HSP40/DnaJ peptide-binding protein [Perilla frutescens var. frutescens]
MGEHSRSNPHDLLHILGFANVCRACKSFLSKCYPEKPTIFFKKTANKPKTKLIEDDAKISRFKIHNPSKKHNPDRDNVQEHDGFRQENYDDNLSRTSSTSSRLSRNLSYHGRKSHTPAQSSKASLLRTLSHKDASSSAFTHSISKSMAAAPIIFSNSSGLIKSVAVEKQLDCTLEELCFGCIKKVSITRDAVRDRGHIEEEDEMVTIKVQPGWRKGTKITFEGKGNQMPGTERGDLIFVIAEKEHTLFKREEDDLQLGVEILLVDALSGCTLLLPLLGGETTSLTIEDIVHPGYEMAIEGEGMPKHHEPGARGNLIINISVKFPEALTEEQRSSAAGILQQAC